MGYPILEWAGRKGGIIGFVLTAIVIVVVIVVINKSRS